MSLEFPMLTMAKQMELSLNSDDFSCQTFFAPTGESTDLLDAASAETLCTKSIYF